MKNDSDLYNLAIGELCFASIWPFVVDSDRVDVKLQVIYLLDWLCTFRHGVGALHISCMLIVFFYHSMPVKLHVQISPPPLKTPGGRRFLSRPVPRSPLVTLMDEAPLQLKSSTKQTSIVDFFNPPRLKPLPPQGLLY